jgi:adenine-specific DNA methylase
MSTEHSKKDNAVLFRDMASQLIYLLFVINLRTHSDTYGIRESIASFNGYQNSMDRDTSLNG